jgi:hypothetical protein
MKPTTSISLNKPEAQIALIAGNVDKSYCDTSQGRPILTVLRQMLFLMFLLASFTSQQITANAVNAVQTSQNSVNQTVDNKPTKIAIFYDASQVDSSQLMQSLIEPLTKLYSNQPQLTPKPSAKQTTKPSQKPNAKSNITTNQSSKDIAVYDINLSTVSELKQKALLAKQCLVTLDTTSAKKMAALRLQKQIFALNIPRLTLDKLSRIYKPLGVAISGIYQEQSFQRQLFLADAIDKNLKQIGLLLSQNDSFELNQYQNTAAQQSHQLNFRLLNSIESAHTYLATLFQTQTTINTSEQTPIPLKAETVTPQKKYLLLTNNQTLYSAKPMVELVLMASRLNIHLIGSTLQQSKNGALASVYLPQNALIEEALEDIKGICQQQRFRPPHFAKQYQVTINQQIARNSNIKNINQSVLLKEMQQAEKHWANTKRSNSKD